MREYAEIRTVRAESKCTAGASVSMHFWGRKFAQPFSPEQNEDDDKFCFDENSILPAISGRRRSCPGMNGRRGSFLHVCGSASMPWMISGNSSLQAGTIPFGRNSSFLCQGVFLNERALITTAGYLIIPTHGIRLAFYFGSFPVTTG